MQEPEEPRGSNKAMLRCGDAPVKSPLFDRGSNPRNSSAPAALMWRHYFFLAGLSSNLPPGHFFLTPAISGSATVGTHVRPDAPVFATMSRHGNPPPRETEGLSIICCSSHGGPAPLGAGSICRPAWQIIGVIGGAGYRHHHSTSEGQRTDEAKLARCHASFRR
jgi:hypothetical protein